MNNLKNISQLIIDATMNVIHSKYKNKLKIENFTCRIGSGTATHLKTKTILGSKHYEITYGIKNLYKKQKMSTAMSFATVKEIIERKYFDFENLTFKNLIVAVILHEYAHVIQNIEKKRFSGSVHNKYFYDILDGFYQKNYHIELDNYLNQYDDYKNAKFIKEIKKDEDKVKKTFVKNELFKGDFVKFLFKGQYEIAKIEKINPKRLVAKLVDSNIEFTIPYELILKSYKTLPK